MSEILWILGAADPEMNEIETLLRKCGENVAYAVDEHGDRVRPGNAYRAHCEAARGHSGTAYLVECAVDALDAGVAGSVDCDCSVVRIDHHCPGHPGYGRPPSDFLPASSLGQVIAELARLGRLPDWISTREDGSGEAGRLAGEWTDAIPRGLRASACGEDSGSPPAIVVGTDVGDGPVVALVPRNFVLAAAADHCLGAAYRCKCPGVDPDELMRWRAESRARFQKRSVEEVLADVRRAQAELREAPKLTLATVADDRDRYGQDPEWSGYPAVEFDSRPIEVTDMRRDEPVPELPEAAMRLGVGYVSGPLVGPDGRRKYTCSGTREQVRAFLKSWAPAQRLVDLYGDPGRGFAGGYEE